MSSNRPARIKERLQQALNPIQVEVIDDSHLHAGHAGARDGRGHFRVHVVTHRFAGLGRVQRHQLIYQSLGELMQTDIHALSITALTPDESSNQAI